MSKRRPTFEDFREKALKKRAFKAEYEPLGPAFEMKRKMIAMRKEAGLTQSQMAELLGTKRSNISRLESVSSDVSRHDGGSRRRPDELRLGQSAYVENACAWRWAFSAA
jgi:hypothetical protein